MQVSELLGSFGDNELSPECLDAAQHLLTPEGVCIPQSYTSFLAPVATHAVHAALVAMPEAQERLQTPLVVKLDRQVQLASPVAAFSFHHPNLCVSVAALR